MHPGPSGPNIAPQTVTDPPEGPNVVALGMSAGGPHAASTFFSNIPADTGLAFVVVQHLDPHHDSALAALLGKATTMPVVQIQHGMALQKDRVHVIPPGAALTVSNGVLALLPRAPPPSHPVDSFLRALAADHGTGAVAVILSGNGADGALGVGAVREHGGMTLAQDPNEAAFGGMPLAAMATGCVDVVLPAAGLGREVGRLAHPVLTGAGDVAPAAHQLGDILGLVQGATGLDFRRYRQTTVARRLWRRVVLRGLHGLPEYLEDVRRNTGELQELARDILISVTRFFRDPEVFSFVSKTTFVDLIRRATGQGPVRFWVPGCSTGEEAYSLAMAFVETAQELNSQVTCQVFATDINEGVLDRARRGVYADTIEEDVSPQRLARFFTRDKEGYRISRGLRSLCVFSRHDLLVDPPLSRMDMVSCRNVLMYMDTVRAHALGRFHFALVPGGYLLLGRSETISSSPELFEPLDQDVKLFRARASVTGRFRQLDRPRKRGTALQVPEPPANGPAYEEVLAANEELQSLNEELQSLNEELEKSKEKIESIHEEQVTLNQELHARNAALRVAQEFSEATLDTVRSGLVVLDPDERVVSANRSFCRTFQLNTLDVEHQLLPNVLPEVFEAPGLQELLKQARGDGVIRDVELEFVRASRRRVLLFGARRFNPGALVLLSVDDVTELRQMEADQRQSQKMEAIGHLAAGVAHDFNNLLTVMLANASLAREGVGPDTPTGEALHNVEAAARRAADLTRQLLAYAGKSRTFAERVVLSDVVAQTANLMHATVPPHVQVRLELDNALPLLFTDPSQMHQVVGNLLTNAVEAVGDGPGKVLVRTGSVVVDADAADATAWRGGTRPQPGPHVFVEVQDTGVGMSQDTLRQMFDPFFTTKFTGRGLGLAAVHGIVTQHRGAITVDSVLGRGTAIRVLFPVLGSTAPSPVAPPRITTAAPRGTVLVVDDEAMVRDATATVLKRQGHLVLTAASGRHALELLAANPGVDVVVLDATMPEMDGLETLALLRTRHPQVPVLVCSGLGDAAVEQTFANKGVAGFIHKPFAMADLVAAVDRCLAP